MPPMPGAGSRSARLALFLCTCAFWGVLLEAGLRVWRSSHSGPTTHPGLVEDDPVLGWRLAPSATLRHRTVDFDVEIRTDSRGERALGADVSDANVWWCGDSLAFGWGVEAAESSAALVADALGEPVRNLSVSGHGTDQEYLRFEEVRRSEPPPREVVLVACENDVVEVMRKRMYGAQKPRFHLEADGTLAGSTTVERSFLERWSALARFVHKRLDPPDVPTEDEARNGRATMAALLRLWSQRCHEDGSGFLVVVTGEGTAAAAASLDRDEVLDVRPILERAAEEGGAVVFEHDAHWNARGHRVVAGAVAEVLRARRDRRVDGSRRN